MLQYALTTNKTTAHHENICNNEKHEKTWCIWTDKNDKPALALMNLSKSTDKEMSHAPREICSRSNDFTVDLLVQTSPSLMEKKCVWLNALNGTLEVLRAYPEFAWMGYYMTCRVFQIVTFRTLTIISAMGSTFNYFFILAPCTLFSRSCNW